VLFACGVIIIAGVCSLMGSVLCQGTVTVIVLLAPLGLAGGHPGRAR